MEEKCIHFFQYTCLFTHFGLIIYPVCFPLAWNPFNWRTITLKNQTKGRNFNYPFFQNKLQSNYYLRMRYRKDNRSQSTILSERITDEGKSRKAQKNLTSLMRKSGSESESVSGSLAWWRFSPITMRQPEKVGILWRIRSITLPL